MRRFDFDTRLVALNAADGHRLPFALTALPEAARRSLGVIAMKVYARGAMIGPGRLSADEAMGYVLSLPGVTTAAIGCSSPAEVDENARAARRFAPLGDDRRQELESRVRPLAGRLTDYKGPTVMGIA